MLVAAFEIEVRGPGQLWPERQHRFVARARVEPDVEDVVLALERRPRRISGTSGPSGTNSVDGPLVPGVGAVLVEHGRRRSTIAPVRTASPQLRAVERRNRHAPGALARDAPVGAARRPCCRCGRGPRLGSTRTCWSIASKRRLAQRARRRAVGRDHGSPSIRTNHWDVARKITGIVAAPAVRVGVLVRLVVPQPSAFGERLHDRRDSLRTPARPQTARPRP